MFDYYHQIKILLFTGRSVGRPVSLMFVLVLLAACTSMVKTTHVSKRTRAGAAMSLPGDMSREQMFDALSSHEWCTDPTSPPGTSSRVLLLRDGRQNLMLSDDDSALMAPTGSWNFAKLGAHDGALYIASDDTDDTKVTRIILFRFPSYDELELVNTFGQLSTIKYFRCQPLSTSAIRTSRELPALDLGSPWKQLAGTRWRINSELFGVSPTAIQFETAGTVLVSLPSAECTEETRRNRDYGWPVGAPAGSSCIKRTPFDADEYRLTHGVLVHQKKPYLRENDVFNNRRFWLVFAVARLEGAVTYVPPLWTNPRRFQIELWGDGIRRLSGASLAITQFGGDAGSGGLDLAAIPLQGALSPEGTVLLDVTIADFPSNPPNVPVALDFSLRTPGGPTEFNTFYYKPQ
jgi:hypothetical protein